MRRKNEVMICIVLVLCCCLSCLFSAKTEINTAMITFNANIVANFGFSSGPVLGPTKPTELPEGDTIVFSEYQEVSNTLTTPVRYIYWQIFTDENVTLTANWTDLASSDGTTVAWEDLRGNLVSEDKELLLYEANEQKIDSLAFQLAVDDVNSIDWSKEPYNGTITLTFKAVGT